MKTAHVIGAGIAALLIGGYLVSKYPRGIRNNNPGNLRQANQNWQGEIGTDKDGFVIFDTMQNGVRAMAITLINYQFRHGLNTVRGIIRRYAPSVENDTESYIEHAAQAIGVAPDEPFAIEPYLADLVGVMIKHENGRGVADYDLMRGVSAALKAKGLV